MALQLTEEERKDLKDAFNLFDLDGNGTIDVKELRGALDAMGFQSRGGDSIYMMIARIDTDGNGTVSFEEFSDFFMQQFTERADRVATKQVFDMFDYEGKGAISLDDMQKVSEDMGNILDEKNCADYFSMVNTSGTGYITFEEFYSVYSKGKFALNV